MKVRQCASSTQYVQYAEHDIHAISIYFVSRWILDDMGLNLETEGLLDGSYIYFLTVRAVCSCLH